MAYQYNPQGALNGLFAPAYIPGNPQAVAATTAWNSARQAQIRPGPPAGTPPAGAPPAGMPPGVQGGIQRPLGIPPAVLARLPPQVQARFGGAPSQGGSFTFTEPTLPPAAPPGGGSGTAGPMQPLPSVQPPVNRDSIAQTMMAKRGFGGV